MRLLLWDHVIHSTWALQTRLWIKIYISMLKFLNNSSLQSSSFVHKQLNFTILEFHVTFFNKNIHFSRCHGGFFMELKLLKLEFQSKLKF